MTNLEKLRAGIDHEDWPATESLMRQAADEIEGLRRRVQTLRAEAKEHDNEVRDAARGAAIEERWAAEERSRNYDC